MDVALQDCPGSLCGSVEASTQTGFSRKVRNRVCHSLYALGLRPLKQLWNAGRVL